MVEELSALAERPSAESLMQAVLLCQQAKDYLRNGHLEQALETARTLIANSPIAERAKSIAIIALDFLNDSCYDEGDYQGAIRYLDEWLALKPEDVYPRLRKAEILWIELDDAKAAEPLYKSIVRDYPNCLEGWIGLAEIALYHRHHKRAFRYLQRAWASLENPKWVYPPTSEIVGNVLESLYVLTARLLTALGDVPNAERVLTMGMERVGLDSPYITAYIIEARDLVHRLLDDSDSEP